MPITKKEMEEFCERIKKNFSPPFLDDKDVQVTVYDDHFNLRILRRDVDFDLNLVDTGAGTRMF